MAQHYTIVLTGGGRKATALTWKRQPRQGSMATHPGVYCLRSNQTDWDEESLWRTYTTLTDVEAVFRSLKPATPKATFPDHRLPLLGLVWGLQGPACSREISK